MASTNHSSINVRVMTMDADLEFAILKSTTGKQLFDQVVKTIGLREIWFFGLQYTDAKGFVGWLKLDKKVVAQDVKQETPLQFKFRVKFYPENVADELIQNITVRLFYLQVKNAILSDEIYCPPEACVLLASFALQAKYVGFNKDFQMSGALGKDRLLPKRVMDQHGMPETEWEERILTWWEEHKGMLKEEAMMEYLKVAQDLEMFGVNYYEIKNKKGTQLWLGVDALGLNIYEREDRLTPKIGFPWSEIKHISFSNKKFIIKPIDKKSPDFIFFASRLRINKQIVALCKGNHQLYITRRKPDSLEVQQMKTQAREEKMAKQREREKLQNEIAAREEAEKKHQEYEGKLKNMEKKMDMKQQQLIAAQATIRHLEIQLKKLQEAKEELEERQKELQEMMDELEANSELELTERQIMEEEIRMKQQEVLRIREEVEAKDQETRRLQEEIEEARRRQTELDAAVLNTRAAGPPPPPKNALSEAEVNEKRQAKLRLLKEELSKIRDETMDTPMDQIHESNLQHGRNKYKTLRDIRKGNTKRRVDAFENM